MPTPVACLHVYELDPSGGGPLGSNAARVRRRAYDGPPAIVRIPAASHT